MLITKFKNNLLKWLLTTNHKRIANLYFIFGMFSGVAGTAIIILFRIELTQLSGRVFPQGTRSFFYLWSASGWVILLIIVFLIIGGFFIWYFPLRYRAGSTMNKLVGLLYFIFGMFSGLLRALITLWIQNILDQPQLEVVEGEYQLYFYFWILYTYFLLFFIFIFFSSGFFIWYLPLRGSFVNGNNSPTKE